jgi:hypothetical protein
MRESNGTIGPKAPAVINRHKMPNDCWNTITLKATNEQIREILTTEFTDVPPWAFRVLQVGQEALICKLWSAWRPDKSRINNLLNKYNGLWVKDEWTEEGGGAGIIVGTKDELQDFSWDEGCIEEWGHRLREAPNIPSPVLADNASSDHE